MKSLADTLRSKRVVVCVGPGGVGKTTVAATIALRAAMEGMRALVVTIDPARRLANSLGLERLGNVEALIGPELFARAGLTPAGELWAMMLDVKRTSDDLVARHSTSREQAERIYSNRFYQTASTVLAGSQEYMAMEKLYDLNEEKRFDLVVLDTPPTSNALDFLDAPNRVLDVLSNDSLRWLATPAVAAGKVGVRAVGMGSGYFIRQISKFTGIETLQALAEFLISMQGMYDGFKDRAGKVKSLLASDETAFVLVTAPGSVKEARYFHSVLGQGGLPVGAVVMNRIHPDWRRAAGDPLDAASLRTWFPNSLADRLAASVEEHQILAGTDAEAARSMAREISSTTTLRLVPILDRDVHDIAGLALMARCLFEGDGLSAMSALPCVEPGSRTGGDSTPSESSREGPNERHERGAPLKAVLPLFLALIAGCGAHLSPTETGPQDEVLPIELEAVEIFAGDEDSLFLASLNEEELFQAGAAAFAAGELERSARAFSLFVAAFPESELHSLAQYNAAFSWEKAGEYLLALELYDPLLHEFDGQDWLDAIHRVTECLFHLEDFHEAARILGEVLSIETLPPNDRMRALVQQGVSLLEAGHEEEALSSLRSAVGRYHIELQQGEEKPDAHYAARAQFYLGEIYRRRFERARLDPAETDFDTLAEDLEHKAQLLLSAQGHYLRAIRMGEPEWAAASGHQVGRLYEELYRQITGARMPTGLEGATERIAYLEMLREQVRVLLEKALLAYEQTLAAAERLGIDGAWRGRIESSLERVKSLLLDEDSWSGARLPARTS